MALRTPSGQVRPMWNLADLGLQLTRRRLLEGGAGFVIGAVAFSAIALIQAAMVGVSWQISGTDVADAVMVGLPVWRFPPTRWRSAA